jgi:uncharacterized protein YqgV (UPF0045/DUF77 family)
MALVYNKKQPIKRYKMKISVELTLMPLQDDYRNHIVSFIKRLRNSNFHIEENSLSTQVYGDYDEVMLFLNKELKESFIASNAIIANMKIVKSDRSNYEPRF